MSLTLQFITMTAMVGSGIYLGMAIDTFNRFYRKKKRNGFIRYTNEILFWILQGLILFYILYLVNQGELRLYVWLAVIFGFAFYQSVFRVWYLKSLEHIIQWAVATIRFCRNLFERLIIAPIKWLLKLVTYLLTLFWAFIIWLILIPWKIFQKPLLYFWSLIKKLIPKNTKKYLLSFHHFCSKIYNTINNWTRSLFSKRR
ncbi:spore cortex biosynthesis protein YabQ [Salirhabdus euzebyi]|uniref:Spore cortex biosynthesis protein YabQ n=1 Tax=Salirhabdus euzebyi TaxID=394506 RepID=A0A841QAE4_9BACI|nr:spore cortex biosynthesis protein YabQ [Salirhabdus euzebyi]